MTTPTSRAPLSWSARLLIALVLIVAGAAAMTWALTHYPPMARLLGVVQPPPVARPAAVMSPVPRSVPVEIEPDDAARVAALEARLARVENMTESAAGSAGRADALLVAFAARRAIDRGVALGYLENRLVQRFGRQHPAAVSTVITASRRPVTLSELTSEFERLGPQLRRGGPTANWWDGVSRELAGLVQLRRADRPPADLNLRYQRALHSLSLGRVDVALAEVMRMPGATNARDWTNRARRYVATQRALDELETAALLGSAPAA